jgi:hypothetical protein
VVSSRALKAEGRGVRRRVLADGAALALIEAQACFELARWTRLLLLGCNIRQVKADDRRHWARGSRCARCNEARRALGSACQARLAGELPVPTCWASGADSCTRAWSVVPSWALWAVQAAGLGDGEVAVPALQYIVSIDTVYCEYRYSTYPLDFNWSRDPTAPRSGRNQPQCTA